ncbi:MAG TPA: hypothetical protein VLS89_05825 [Candidatus Nanopelagicales bacterium]|nr:hypothetical protein [Candidatus Nanopelagicales bacterium]
MKRIAIRESSWSARCCAGRPALAAYPAWPSARSAAAIEQLYDGDSLSLDASSAIFKPDTSHVPGVRECLTLVP